MKLTGGQIKNRLIILAAIIIMVVVGFLVYQNLVLKSEETATLNLATTKEKELIDWQLLNSEIFKGLKEQPMMTTSSEITGELGRENPFLKFY